MIMDQTQPHSHAPRIADFGRVRSVEVRPGRDDAEALSLHMVLPDGQTVSLPAQREALRGLWSYLMQVLYPRAVDLTRRVETVPQSPHGLAPDITYRFSAYAEPSDPGQVAIAGFAQNLIWKASIDRQECEYLWASLERHLGQV